MGATSDLLPREVIEHFVSYLGLSYGGDLGGWTIYQNKHGKPVFYPRAIPAKPPTPNQMHQRIRFRIAQANWKALPQASRAEWERITLKLSLCMTGQNLYISLQLVDRSPFWPAVQRKAQTSLTYPAMVPP